MGMRARVMDDDRGAVAVEFALVSVLLFTLLFGIIQYGFLFFQYQAAAATVHDAARMASQGLDPGDFGGGPIPDPCVLFALRAQAVADGNGIPAAQIDTVGIDWDTTPIQRGTTGVVTLVFTPTPFGAAFVPVPDTITVSAVATVEVVGVQTLDCNPVPL